MGRLPLPSLTWIALLLALCGSCASVNPMPSASPGEVPGLLSQAQADLEQGRDADALFRLQRVWEVPGITPEERNAAASLLAEAAPRAAAAQVDGYLLVEIAELDLPRRTKIQLWVAGAERLLEVGERKDSYRAVKDLEALYPQHYLRHEAGDVVAEAGLSLAADPRRHHLFFKYRDEAPELLEYLTLAFPSNASCDLAYSTLGEIYEEKRRWDNAIQAHRDLLLFHSNSRFATYSEARIPYLRTRQVQSTAFDRGAMIEAEAECETWLERHPFESLNAEEATLHGHVVELLHEVRRRLVLNDLHVADFYTTIGNRYGAELHAERGLELAEAIAEEPLAERCRAVLAVAENLSDDLDPARVLGTGGPGLGPEDFGITAELPAELLEEDRPRPQPQQQPEQDDDEGPPLSEDPR